MALVVKKKKKKPSASAGDVTDAGLIPVSGRSPGGGHGNALQHSCLRIPWTEKTGRVQSTGSQRVDTTEGT